MMNIMLYWISLVAGVEFGFGNSHTTQLKGTVKGGEIIILAGIAAVKFQILSAVSWY